MIGVISRTSCSASVPSLAVKSTTILISAEIFPLICLMSERTALSYGENFQFSIAPKPCLRALA